jgi:hypothetical protein
VRGRSGVKEPAAAANQPKSDEGKCYRLAECGADKENLCASTVCRTGARPSRLPCGTRVSCPCGASTLSGTPSAGGRACVLGGGGRWIRSPRGSQCLRCKSVRPLVCACADRRRADGCWWLQAKRGDLCRCCAVLCREPLQAADAVPFPQCVIPTSYHHDRGAVHTARAVSHSSRKPATWVEGSALWNLGLSQATHSPDGGIMVH